MFRIARIEPDLVPVFRRVAEQDLAFAKRVTITRLSGVVQQALTGEIRRAVNNPNPYTLRAVQRRPVRADGRRVLNPQYRIPPGQPFAFEVYLADDDTSRGVAQARYLAPLVYGGARAAKRSEVAFRKAGVMAADQYAIPGVAARRNAQGDVTGGQVRQLLSYLQAADLVAGSTQNTSQRKRDAMARGSKKRRGVSYFVSAGPGKGRGTGRGNAKRQHLKAGIYQRTAFAWGTAIKPVMVFADKAPRYQPVLKFFEVAQRTVAANYQREFELAIGQALRSSRSASR